jgi:ribosome maturation factor RimP
LLKGVNDGVLTMNVEGVDVEISLLDIDKARLAPEF